MTEDTGDLGSGFIVAVFDHGTAQARIRYDNLTPEQIVALAEAVRVKGEECKKLRDRERMKEEVGQELENEKPEDNSQ